jgi:hypothetical protein
VKVAERTVVTIVLALTPVTVGAHVTTYPVIGAAFATDVPHDTRSVPRVRPGFTEIDDGAVGAPTRTLTKIVAGP